MPRYEETKEGDWVRLIAKGYNMMCCDCGLVHQMDFRVARGFKV